MNTVDWDHEQEEDIIRPSVETKITMKTTDYSLKTNKQSEDSNCLRGTAKFPETNIAVVGKETSGNQEEHVRGFITVLLLCRINLSRTT